MLIATIQIPFTRGGAELLASELLQALQSHGHEADIVAIPSQWHPPERILDSMLACRLLDCSQVAGRPVDRLIGLKFPAYLVPHPRKVLWILHQHRTAYDLWDHDLGDLIRYPNGRDVRAAIEEADRRLIPEARSVYTISRNVSKRLEKHCGTASEPLYHPPRHAERFRSGDPEGYLFFPSRINLLKRQALVIDALPFTREAVRVRFAGRADIGSYAEELKVRATKLGVADRVQWLGEIGDDEMVEQYARCRAVVYPPVDEDYGYVTLEAMLSAKAVITCRDSGGSLEFVSASETGLVAEPTPEGLAAAMDELWRDPDRAVSMGRAGRARYDALGIDWARVVRTLCQ